MKIDINKNLVIIGVLMIVLLVGHASLRGQNLAEESTCCGGHAATTQEVEAADEHEDHDHDAVKEGASCAAPCGASDDHAGHDHGAVKETASCTASGNHEDHDHDAVKETASCTASDEHAGHDHAAVKESSSCGASDGHNHGGHGGHDHSLKDVGSKPVEELYAKDCEHQIKSIDCDECRYELGAVKITEMLLKMIKTSVMQKTNIKQAVNFRGELEFDNNLLRTVTSPVLGVIGTMNVRVGDSVKAGQVLAVLESRELAGTALELQKLSSELSLAQKKYEREELLNSKKIGAAESVQNAKQAYDSLVLENKRLRGQLRIMGVPSSEIDKIENGQDNAALFGKLSLVAPVNGRVTKVFATIGGAIGEYQPVAEIADISKLRIKAFVAEKDIMPLLENAKTNNITGYLRVGAFNDVKFDVR
ncbi:MAG: efflux RND transporter periplasmic adaptor subunit, partial [Candidatus Riflebacteria bacterium]|nr:efflux RND transporter periplasmic adaptor subunit [Candidatus Riflebacteria bacterium]